MARDDVIIASNTSYLDVFPLLPAGRQKRSMIAHWYTPPYICDLVDLAPGPETDPGVVSETLRELYAGMGKEPVVFGSMLEGYIANRLQAALHLEVFDLLDAGHCHGRGYRPLDPARPGAALRDARRAAQGGFHRPRHDAPGNDQQVLCAARGARYQPDARQADRGRARRRDVGRRLLRLWRAAAPAELLRERDVELIELKRALEAIEKKRTA